MLYDPTRHEPLRGPAWNEDQSQEAIRRIVRDTEARFSADRYWPLHPLDIDGEEDSTQVTTTLYHGACGVVWALHYLQAVGAASLSRRYIDDLDRLRTLNRALLVSWNSNDFASFLMGDTPIEMLGYGDRPDAERRRRIEALIAGNLDHPARELMWGSPGTLLAALFLHERTGDSRWAELFKETATELWSKLLWSPEYGCHYWTQDMYSKRSTYLDAVHGFVATASPLIRGRHLLSPDTWAAWQACIATTVARTAIWDRDQASWPTQLLMPTGVAPKMLMQFCHGAPGFVTCLGDFPGAELDELLLAAGRAVWAAGPLAKGSNLCHGTGGNGYAFLKLYKRTQDPVWLDRARAFAMHGIAQTEADAVRYGQMRYSLWTGDAGFAVYLWNCVRGAAAFPTLDVFFA